MASLIRVLPLLFVIVPCAWGQVAADARGGAPVAVLLSASMPDGDAARHAKRTACLKEAKDRKLIGAQKAAFLKECFGSR